MFKQICLCVLLLVSSQALAFECPKWTKEQEAWLLFARDYGAKDNLGQTLAAIVAKESFVGPYIVKINPKDSFAGSYGITHITLEFAMEQLGVKNIWEAKQDLVLRLMSDDKLALDLAIKKLKLNQKLGWRSMVYRYNGKGVSASNYLAEVTLRLKQVQNCLPPEQEVKNHEKNGPKTQKTLYLDKP